MDFFKNKTLSRIVLSKVIYCITVFIRNNRHIHQKTFFVQDTPSSEKDWDISEKLW